MQPSWRMRDNLSLGVPHCLASARSSTRRLPLELIFVGTTNFDKALYTEGCDVEHLLEGLGDKGITKLFHNLSILAWAVVIARVGFAGLLFGARVVGGGVTQRVSSVEAAGRTRILSMTWMRQVENAEHHW